MFSRSILSSLLALTLVTTPLATQAGEPPADGEDAAAEEGGDEAAADEAPADAGDGDGDAGDGDADGGDGDAEEEAAGDGDGDAEEATGDGDAEEEEAGDGDAEEEVEQAETEDPEAAMPPPTPEDPRGPEPRIADKPATGKGLLIAGGSVAGVGAGFLVTSILVTRCEYGTPLDCRYGNQDTFLIPAAITVTSVGVLLLAAGAVSAVRYKKWEKGTLYEKKKGRKAKATAMFGPTYLPSGAGVGAVGKF